MSATFQILLSLRLYTFEQVWIRKNFLQGLYYRSGLTSEQAQVTKLGPETVCVQLSSILPVPFLLTQKTVGTLKRQYHLFLFLHQIKRVV